MRSAARKRALPAAGLMGAALALGLAACQPTTDTGYVEIKTVPASTAITAPGLYLDAVKLDAPIKGTAVLRQRTGTVKLATAGRGGELIPLCDIVVKKNRLTTVTVSIVERPPRCQCRNRDGASARTCLS